VTSDTEIRKNVNTKAVHQTSCNRNQISMVPGHIQHL